jgi:hypothetical protein
VATDSPAKRIPADVCPRPRLPRSALFSAILVFLLFPSPLPISAQLQIVQAPDDQPDAPTSVHGKVLNRLTQEPISRALVFSPDNRYAMLTDDRGRFEFKLPPRIPPSKDEQSPTSDTSVLRARQLRMLQNARPNFFNARKPGFLPNSSNPVADPANQPDLVIYLDPESLIVGNVNLPGSEGDMRIHVTLYRRDVIEGREHWQQAKTFTTWADGDFRFAELEAGTYRVGTDELLDRNPTFYPVGSQLFGFTPVFYPGVADFASAVPIQLAVGATVQVSLGATRRAYYSVKIPVVNAGDARAMTINVYPLGRPGPGFSLSYNNAEQLIQGSLPDGTYTLQAATEGPAGSTGSLNFSIQGAPYEGTSSINLIPNTSVPVTLREEFKSGETVFGELLPPSEDDAPNQPRQRLVNVQVVLQSIDEFGSAPAFVSEPAQGTQENQLVISNVRPGRYHVQVQTGVGYTSQILYGGTSLLRQPLVVSVGGASQPLEITLRDDSAQVDGTVEDATVSQIYFLPLDDDSGEFRQAVTQLDGSFAIAQVPPGTYRVLAFDHPLTSLLYNDPEAMRKLASMGQAIHLDPGQNQHLKLKLSSGGDLP